MFVLILNPRVFFLGKWVPKTKINFEIFYQNFCHSYFLGANLVSKFEVLQINWNMVQGLFAICLLWFKSLFFQNFCHSFFAFLDKFGHKIWSCPNQISFGARILYYMLTGILILILFILLILYYIIICIILFFQIFMNHFVFFFGKFSIKIWCCPNWMEYSICVHYLLIIIKSSNISQLSCSKY